MFGPWICSIRISWMSSILPAFSSCSLPVFYTWYVCRFLPPFSQCSSSDVSFQVPIWKDLALRVFVLASLDVEETHKRQLQLRQQLRQLRIKARIEIVNRPNIEEEIATSFQINHMLLENSTSHTAVVFLYLPLPPNERNHEYMSALSTVTDSLPPTVLVHGISPVTSTNL